MADIQRRKTSTGEVRWDVRYRDEAHRQRKRTFARKVDAQRFASGPLVSGDGSLSSGVRPLTGVLPFEDGLLARSGRR